MTEALTPRAWLERLVAFDTTSVKPNLPLIEDVAAYLQRAGVAHVHVNRSSDGIHANLLATLPAADGSVEGGLIFSGHTDVVPVTGQQWTSDPFKLVERDGKLYGRGSCDMKGFIAVCLSLVPEWLRSKRTKPVHLVLTYNEETDFAGVKQLLGDLGKHIEKCEGCIVGEPTEMDLIVSHKGIAAHRIICKGKAAHSSLQTSGYNAFEPASRMLSTLFELRDRFSKEGPFEDGFAIPHTTLCPSQISGGIAMNTIPERCEISFEFRNVPNHDARSIRKEIAQRTAEESSRLAAACPGASVELEFTRPPTAAFKGDPNATVVKALQAASEEPKAPVKVSFCTEAGEYQTVGVNTVVCGPGSIAQAHSADEYVSIEQLEICARVLQRVVSLMCGGSSSSGSASRL